MGLSTPGLMCYAVIPGKDVPIGNDLVKARERQRRKEWLTDVPLIGEIYQSAKALTYPNGLGRIYQVDADCVCRDVTKWRPVHPPKVPPQNNNITYDTTAPPQP